MNENNMSDNQKKLTPLSLTVGVVPPVCLPNADTRLVNFSLYSTGLII